MKRNASPVLVALVFSLAIFGCGGNGTDNFDNPADPATALKKPSPPPPANPAIVYVDYSVVHVKGVQYLGGNVPVPSVFVMDADGSNKTALWNYYTVSNHNLNYGQILTPVWSGNGQSICFCMNYSSDKDVFTADISLVNGVPTASNVTQIVSGSGANWYGQPAWSPTANEIAFIAVQTGGFQKIVVLPSTGGTPTTIYTCTAAEYNVHSPHFSPDGSKIAFILRNDLTHEHWIKVYDRTTHSELNSIDLGSDNTYVSMDWSRTANSSVLVFDGGPVGSGISNIYTLDFSISSTPTLATGGQYPSWSPNDDQISLWNTVGYGICKFAFAGSTTTVLSSTGSWPNWKR